MQKQALCDFSVRKKTAENAVYGRGGFSPPFALLDGA